MPEAVRVAIAKLVWLLNAGGCARCQALCNWWLLAGTCAVLPPRRPACPDAGFSVLAGASAASPPIAIAFSLFRVHSYFKSWVIWRAAYIVGMMICNYLGPAYWW